MRDIFSDYSAAGASADFVSAAGASADASVVGSGAGGSTSGVEPSFVTLRLICVIFSWMVLPQTVFRTRTPCPFFFSPTPWTAKIFLRSTPGTSFRIGNPQLSDPPVIKNSYPAIPIWSPLTACPSVIPIRTFAYSSPSSFWTHLPSFVPMTSLKVTILSQNPRPFKNVSLVNGRPKTSILPKQDLLRA